jgi:DNA helicase II / ATP-dependent DNA helicase PcrA
MPSTGTNGEISKDASQAGFLSEIDQKFIHYPQTGGKPFPKSKMSDDRHFSREEPAVYTRSERLKPVNRAVPKSEPSAVFATSDPSVFEAGNPVEHERFGKGVIISIEGNVPNTTATVEFEKEGKKKLLLRFAKLRKS